MRSEFQSPVKADYAEYWRKCLQEIFRMAQGVPPRMDFIGRLRMVQSDANPNKTGRIVGCSIIYVTFLIVCNSIIKQC